MPSLPPMATPSIPGPRGATAVPPPPPSVDKVNPAFKYLNPSEYHIVQNRKLIFLYSESGLPKLRAKLPSREKLGRCMESRGRLRMKKVGLSGVFTKDGSAPSNLKSLNPPNQHLRSRTQNHPHDLPSTHPPFLHPNTTIPLFPQPSRPRPAPFLTPPPSQLSPSPTVTASSRSYFLRYPNIRL